MPSEPICRACSWLLLNQPPTNPCALQDKTSEEVKKHGELAAEAKAVASEECAEMRKKLEQSDEHRVKGALATFNAISKTYGNEELALKVLATWAAVQHGSCAAALVQRQNLSQRAQAHFKKAASLATHPDKFTGERAQADANALFVQIQKVVGQPSPFL